MATSFPRPRTITLTTTCSPASTDDDPAAAGLGLLLIARAHGPAPPAAGSSSVDAGEQVVVNVIVRGRGNEVAIRVWDRPNVQIDYAEDAPSVDRRSVTFGTARFPLCL